MTSLMAKVGDTWHRFEEALYTEGQVRVIHYPYTVMKVTPCGVWVAYDGIPPSRFVLASARKRFACPTREEALESFLARKRRQVGILQGQLRRAQEAIRQAEGMARGETAEALVGGCWL